MSDTYRSAACETEVEIKIERSRFIGWVRPVNSEQEAKQCIAKRSQLHRQATHNTWAYRVNPELDIRFASDAGEPTGTAGEPILRAILHLDLMNTLVVVTRYFGGRKLGIRGLIDAYGTTASQALAAAGSVDRVSADSYELLVNYPELDQCLHLIKTVGGKVLTADYLEYVTLRVAIPQSKVADFLSQMPPIVKIKDPL
ncbi:MAG TPA: YigZ family protein [bacterium]|jgi:uncharacterized YigZ family protein|nr:YigZ family protein [bacterium]